MKKIRPYILPAVLVATAVVASQFLDAETIKFWAPYAALVYVLVLFAHFETRCDNISMDLEAVEEGLQKIDPEGVKYTALRFRFARPR
jgi:hypothetical protein